MSDNALTIKQSRKMIDNGIWAMFLLFKSFDYKEINEYLETHNWKYDAGDIDTIVIGLLQEMTMDLLDTLERKIH